MPEEYGSAKRHDRSPERLSPTADSAARNQRTVEGARQHARHAASEDTSSRSGRVRHAQRAQHAEYIQREVAPAPTPPAPRTPSLLAWRDRARVRSDQHDNSDGSESSGPPPLARYAKYVAEDPQTYTLLDLASDEEARVSKRRATAEIFPPTRKARAPGAGLLRASGYALLGALLGGAPGIALGLIVALVALVRLSAFERRASTWRRARAPQRLERGEAQRLPAEATSERLRLMTALWQGLGGLVLGGVTLLLLLMALH